MFTSAAVRSVGYCLRQTPAGPPIGYRLPFQLSPAQQLLNRLVVDFSASHVLSVHMSDKESTPPGRLQRVLKILLIAAAVSAAGFLSLIGLTSMFPSLKSAFVIGYINGMAALVLVTAIALVNALFKK